MVLRSGVAASSPNRRKLVVPFDSAPLQQQTSEVESKSHRLLGVEDAKA